MIENALAIGEIKFTLAPKSFTIGNCEKKLPIIRYRGVQADVEYP